MGHKEEKVEKYWFKLWIVWYNYICEINWFYDILTPVGLFYAKSV